MKNINSLPAFTAGILFLLLIVAFGGADGGSCNPPPPMVHFWAKVRQILSIQIWLPGSGSCIGRCLCTFHLGGILQGNHAESSFEPQMIGMLQAQQLFVVLWISLGQRNTLPFSRSPVHFL